MPLVCTQKTNIECMSFRAASKWNELDFEGKIPLTRSTADTKRIFIYSLQKKEF